MSELNGLRLPDPPRISFKRSPLVLTLCQVRFSRVLAVADAAHVAKFQRAVSGDYPVLYAAGERAEEVQVGPGVTLQQHETSSWQFSDQQERWTVVLAQDFLSLETRSYERFEDFQLRFQRLLEALLEHVQPSLLLRIGLRYINEIRLDGRRLSELVTASLLGPLSAPEVGDLTQQSLQQIMLRLPGDELVTVRHGLYPAGSTVKPRRGEQPPADAFYLLDFDAYQTFDPPTSVDTRTIAERIDHYHNTIHRLFRWSITDEFTSILAGARHAS